MAFGAVEGRSQTDVRERLSAAPRSENIAVLRSAARSRRATTAGAAARPASAGEADGTAARLGGWLDLNEENDQTALIMARMYGLALKQQRVRRDSLAASREIAGAYRLIRVLAHLRIWGIIP